MPTPVLITGSAGLLGSAVTRIFRAAGYHVHAVDHRELDITDAAAVEDLTRSIRPQAIVNCAAFNDVDAAEDDPARALKVNAMAIIGLARAARDPGTVLVHYSTDFVFDGLASRPYVESDPPNPQSVYASSKLLGEYMAADAPRHYVLRVESLFGPTGPVTARRGSLGTIVERLRRGETVPVFVDRTVSPSFTEDVAEATRRLIESGAQSGLYHCVNGGAATWLEIAQHAARLLDVELKAQPLRFESVKMKARRPRFCAMSPARLSSLGIVMPDWRDALGRYLGA
jgi:dTDP-4-dehydrorhamnose reductase